ncbi:MAG: hypothetical protein M9949_11600 [Candidatus Kapabacteria bacterium]|nr:hypothetical protein [Candidatus Kapabacteria bacterium]
MCSIRRILLFCITIVAFNLGNVAFAQDFWEQTTGPKDGGGDYEFVYTVAFDSQGNLFAGTAGNGLYRSTDKGTTWVHILTEPQIVWRIAVNSNDVVFACTDQEGIYRSTDGGNTWENIFDEGIWITSIAFDQNDKIFIGTESDGIFSSTDDGDTWVSVWDPGFVFWYLFIDEDDNLYVSTFFDDVHRSTNGGANWESIGFEGDLVWYITQDNDGKLWAGSDVDGLFSSTDGGNTWVQVAFSGSPISTILIDAKGTMIASDYDVSIYRSVDGGTNWSNISSGLSFDAINGTALDEESLVYLASFGGGVYKSRESSSPAVISSIDLTATTFCQGENVEIAFDVAGLFNKDNTFTAELSDETGDFAIPTEIGTTFGQSSGTFLTAYIPGEATAGSMYRIRVVADMPEFESDDNGTNITINSVKPTLVAPANEAIGVALMPELTWNASATCPTLYTIEVSTDKDFINLVLNVNNHSDTSYTFTNSLSMLTEYWWRVGAETESGDVVYSTPSTFTTEDQSEFTHNISLSSGWNMISTYIIPANVDFDAIMNDIKSSIVIAKNNAGQVYYPEFEINDIGNWNINEGYQVFMTQAETLEITGMKVEPENNGIPLVSGWNIISYLRDSQMAIVDALASITDDDNLVIAKDNLGNIYYPEFEIDLIEFMQIGQGYQIYVLSNDTLIYPEN